MCVYVCVMHSCILCMYVTVKQKQKQSIRENKVCVCGFSVYKYRIVSKREAKVGSSFLWHMKTIIGDSSSTLVVQFHVFLMCVHVGWQAMGVTAAPRLLRGAYLPPTKSQPPRPKIKEGRLTKVTRSMSSSCMMQPVIVMRE